MYDIMRAEAEWQRAGAYSVRIQGMNRQHHISLREEFDEHDCDGTRYIVILDDGYPIATFRFYEGRIAGGDCGCEGQAETSCGCEGQAETSCGCNAPSVDSCSGELVVTLGRVVVLPQYRGQGLGKLAVCEAEKWIAELGYREIHIDSRLEATGFYEKLGYVHDADTVIKSGNFDCTPMHKKL